MHWLGILSAASAYAALAVADLIGVPTVPFKETGGHFDLHQVDSIIVDSRFADSRDNEGWTLIPPTLDEFATVFAQDFNQIVKTHNVKAQRGNCGESKYIFLTIGNSSEFVDVAGRWTSEAYELQITSDGIKIIGASPLGAWWGTRTVLQQAALNNGTISQGSGLDSPGWNTRGIFLDVARHYYPPDFIIEMCSWISFWKENTFHIHLSDNLYNNVDIYSLERQLELYARFRPWSDDPLVSGLNIHRNESYTWQDFDRIQRSCAARGVTVIPEIEAPGHALVISQWKPALGIDGHIDLLNITYPETIPTMEDVWSVFLPWFHSKSVHIGADEYADEALTQSELADAYNDFVNAMNKYIRGKSNKSIRIWGTFPPQQNYTNNIPKDVIVQHWEGFEDNAKYDYLEKNYTVINSDDQFYIVNKISSSYPQHLNKTRIFYGNPADGSAWSPNIFDKSNATNNVARNNPYVLGQIAAQWNDFGYNTSTYLEAYWSWRDNLPALADKQWGGKVTEEQYDRIFDTLQAAAPAQNLDRRVKSAGDTIFKYALSQATNCKGNGHEATIRDQSGNHYDARTTCAYGNGALAFTPQCSLTTPLGSKGRDYTLDFTLRQSTHHTGGSLFTGPDSELRSGNGTSTKLILVSAGNAFALNYSLPVGEWVQGSLIGRGNRTFFSANGGTEMEFLALVGINGATLNETIIAVEAPLARIGGNGWEGQMKSVELRGSA